MTLQFEKYIERRGSGSAKWMHYGDDVVPMWVADMDFAAAPAIADAMRARVDHGVFGYARPSDELYDAILTYLARSYGWDVSREAIVFLPGVVPGFNMALNGLLRGGESVVVEPPVYPPILEAPGNWDLERIDVDMVRTEGGWVSDFDRLETALAGAGAFMLCNPQNPTGRSYTSAELERIAAMCARHDVAIISDEVHCDLVLDGTRHTPIASLDPDIAERTITLMAASKTYNIAGLKVAFAVVPSAHLRKRLMSGGRGMIDSLNPLGYAATLAAYRDCSPWRDELLVYLATNRDHIARRLASEVPEIVFHPPEATFLAWLDCSALDLQVTPHDFFLKEARVGLSRGGDFGAGYEKYARLNFGCPRATLDEGLDRMIAAVKAR